MNRAIFGAVCVGLLLAGCAGRGTGGGASTLPLPRAYGFLFVDAGALWAKDPATEEPRELATGLDNPATVAVAPDGSYVAYVALVDGQRDLFVQELDGGTVVQVTDDATVERGIAWAPNSERFVFVGGDDMRLIIADQDGTNPVPLAINQNVSNVKQVSWSEGDRLVYVADQTVFPDEFVGQVFLTGVFTGNTERLTGLPGPCQLPALAPDGGTLVFWTTADGKAGLFSLRLSEDDPERLTSTEGVLSPDPNSAPVWVDSDTLLAVINGPVSGEGNFYRLRTDGSAPLRIAYASGMSAGLAVTQDRRYALILHDGQVVSFDLETLEGSAYDLEAIPVGAFRR